MRSLPSLALAAAALVAIPGTATAAEPVPEAALNPAAQATAEAPASAPFDTSAVGAIRSHWWAPALVSLGLTAVFDSIGIAGARSDGAGINALGGFSILLGTGLTTSGWGLLIADQPGVGWSVFAGTSLAARMGVLGVGWGIAGVQGLDAICVGNDCGESESGVQQAYYAAKQAQAAHTFWVSTDIAIGLSAADVIAQLIAGYLQKDVGAETPHVAPTAFNTGERTVPGLAVSGHF